MFGLGMPELVFGPGKLPELGKALGKGVSELRSAVSKDEEKKHREIN